MKRRGDRYHSDGGILEIKSRHAGCMCRQEQRCTVVYDRFNLLASMHDTGLATSKMVSMDLVCVAFRPFGVARRPRSVGIQIHFLNATPGNYYRSINVDPH